MNTQSQFRSTGFWALIVVLAATGVAMAMIVAFGLAESRAFYIVGYIFLADVYLIASLAAQHTWLRRTIWVGTPVVLAVSLLTVFWPERDYYVEPPNGVWSEDYEWVRTSYGVLSDVHGAMHLVLSTFVVLGFVSLAYQSVRSERVLNITYSITYVTAIAAALLTAFSIIVEPKVRLTPYQLGLGILALTAAAIVIIATLVQRKSPSAVGGQAGHGLTAEHGAAGAGAGAGVGAGVLPATVPAAAGTGAGTGTGVDGALVDGGALAPRPGPQVPGDAIVVNRDELRIVVRELVDEYLGERGAQGAQGEGPELR